VTQNSEAMEVPINLKKKNNNKKLLHGKNYQKQSLEN
jgi:hypothetical protein